MVHKISIERCQVRFRPAYQFVEELPNRNPSGGVLYASCIKFHVL